MQSPTEIRKQITDQIVVALEQNLVPWRQPWRSNPNSGRPANVSSRRAYVGVNPLLLMLHAEKYEFESRWWGTFKQWQALGGMVRKRPAEVDPGHWGAQIVFYKPISRTVVDADTGEEKDQRFPLLRTFTVFNADQVVGKSIEKFQTPKLLDDDGATPNFAPADALIAATSADIQPSQDKAFYVRPMPEDTWPFHRDGDLIVMPRRQNFKKPGAYYETIFHELAHWSEVRVGWDHREHGYSAGELVAEMTGTFLASELGVPDGEDLTNHAAYLKSWLDVMKADPSFIFRASTQASKVTDYLLSFVRQSVSSVSEAA